MKISGLWWWLVAKARFDQAIKAFVETFQSIDEAVLKLRLALDETLLDFSDGCVGDELLDRAFAIERHRRLHRRDPVVAFLEVFLDFGGDLNGRFRRPFRGRYFLRPADPESEHREPCNAEPGQRADEGWFDGQFFTPQPQSFLPMRLCRSACSFVFRVSPGTQ